MSDRLIGQEVSVSILVDGVLQAKINRQVKATFEFSKKIIEEGYLGTTFQEYDSVYMGVKVDLSLNITGADHLTLIEVDTRRAQNRVGGSRISIGSRFRFPNGQTRLLSFPDVHFDSIPLEVGGRAELVAMNLSGMCSQFKIIGR